MNKDREKQTGSTKQGSKDEDTGETNQGRAANHCEGVGQRQQMTHEERSLKRGEIQEVTNRI